MHIFECFTEYAVLNVIVPTPVFTPSVTVAVIVASDKSVEPSNTTRILLFAEV